MTVDELRAALKGIPGHYTLWITCLNDEWPAATVTHERNIIRLTTEDAERMRHETVLFPDDDAGSAK